MTDWHERLRQLAPRPFGIVHLGWAILILAGCVVLVLMGGGHPPPMVFVPPLLAAGLLGHLLLLQIGAARYPIAAIASGWGLALLLQLREARSPGELALGVLLIAGLVGIAVHVLRSGRIRSVLG